MPLEAKLNVSFSANSVWQLWVLSTDYDNYSIVYDCRNTAGNNSEDYAWIMSRQPQLNPAVQKIVDELIDTHFDRNTLHETKQSKDICDPR